MHTIDHLSTKTIDKTLRFPSFPGGIIIVQHIAQVLQQHSNYV
jgi:hypothetical protein